MTGFNPANVEARNGFDVFLSLGSQPSPARNPEYLLAVSERILA
jgi:hypothetical protein